MKQIELKDRRATAAFGEALGAKLQAGDVIALTGDLGAGKTTLAKAIARGMGIESPVTSPTYTLIHEHPGIIPLFHADPYRLENPEDALGFGFDEYFERGGVVLVEWAERVETLLPAERLTVHLEISGDADDDGEAARLLTLTTIGIRYEAIRDELFS